MGNLILMIPLFQFLLQKRKPNRSSIHLLKPMALPEIIRLYETDGACFHHQVGICRGACCGIESAEEYNERAAKALEEFIFARRNFFIIDTGRNEEERCAVKIVNGKYAGYGYFNINDMGFGLTAVHECIKPSADNRDIQVILKSYLKNNRVEKIIEF